MMNRSLLNLILLQNILLAIKVIGMLGVNDGPVIPDDYIAIQIFRNAVNKLIYVGISNGLLLDLMGDIICQMANLLEPAMQKIPELLPSVFEFSLPLLVVFSTEVFREGSPVDLLVIVEGMQGPRPLYDSVSPPRVVDEDRSHVEEVMDLNGSQTQENSSRLQGAIDAVHDMVEVVHPMEAEEAVGDIVLRNIIQLSLNIFLPEVHLRVMRVLSLIEADHILRDVISDYFLDLHAILDESVPEGEGGEAVSAAEVQDAEGGLLVLVLVGDDLDEAVDGGVVEPLLEVVHFGVVSVEGFLCGLELDDLGDHLVQHISDPLRAHLRLAFALFVCCHIESTQKPLKHVNVRILILYEITEVPRQNTIKNCPFPNLFY